MFNPFRSVGDTVKTSALTQLLPWLLLAVVLLLAGSAAGGIWIGKRWAEGTQARKENAALHVETAQLLANAKSLQQNAVDTQLKFDAAATRMGAIAQETENANLKNQAFARAQADAVEQLLRARPELDAVRVGAELLCAWNRAAQGAGAATAATPGCGAKPPAAVPGAAGGSRRSRNHADPKPPAVGADAPRVHRSARRADQGGEGNAAHRQDLVLRLGLDPRVSTTRRVRA